MNDFLSKNIISLIIKHRELVMQFIKRELITKYKGSFLGRFWSVITPLMMLTIYTYVFSVIFKGKWDFAATSSKQEFAITLFCGMLVFAVFSECVTKAPTLITNNPNYVKKVVFPLEILPVSLLGSAVVNFLIGLSILLVGKIIFLHNISWSLLYLPLMLLPLIFLSLGLVYIFSSLGVFLRDLEHSINIIVQALYMLTPIFYPVTAVPENLRGILYINPLTGIVENIRNIVVWGIQPNFINWSIQLIVSLLILIVGYWWFLRTRKGFADVL
ncbi:ABC transporter permease [Paenibacillus rigui]|uniref:Transport permease protein n=1 Tax=Paenibacillus rigui TaxID=554312 RepID=A0A229UT02_9BACL|nr:ABC transporter permease [Paenibacillus rigui]OXM86524.1 sugar ABC transporter permease [Paenibacillus rigui]